MHIVTVTPDTLTYAIEFDSPFRVLADGRVETYLPDVYAPEVYIFTDDEGQQVPNTPDPEIVSDEWLPVTGYSGQDRYSGPVMHESEYLGGGMARDVLAAPGLYVVTSVECLPWEDRERDEREESPAGWVLLFHKTNDQWL